MGARTLTEENVKTIEELYALLNTFLEKTKFIAGDTLTIADFCIITTVSSGELFVPIDEAKFPKLVDWAKRIKELPCYAAGLPGLKKFQDMVLQSSIK